MHKTILIEQFKADSQEIYVNQLRPKAKAFLSSGTTGEQSKSRFSPEGLAAYGRTATEHFRDFLVKHAPQILDGSGISLIPTVDEWPHSSLAWMVDEWAKGFRIDFVTAWEQLEKVVGQKNQACFVFGTAFHFIQLAEENPGRKINLPKNSIVIETGGTKGKTREVTRSELADIIENLFGVDRIFSEYSMCELASQAWGEFDGRFSFPKDVELFSVQGGGEFLREGRGLLAIKDVHRIDVDGVIVTEDVVTLARDQSFILHGRVPGARLKGCSMLAEKVASTSVEVTRYASFDVGNVGQRLEKFLEKFSLYESSGDLWRDFVADSPAEKFAKSFAVKLKESLPQTKSAWLEALNAANDSDQTVWTLILPTNHAAVGLYPLTFASLLGFDMTLRWPKLRNEAPLKSWIKILEQQKLRMLSAQEYFQKATDIRGSLMVYGSDDTVALFRKMGLQNLRAFGSEITIGVVHADELGDLQEVLLEDICELSQRGCKSLRILIVIDARNENNQKLPRWNQGKSCSELKTLKFLHARQNGAKVLSFWSDDLLIAHCSSEKLALFPFEMSLPIYYFDSVDLALKSCLAAFDGNSLRFAFSSKISRKFMPSERFECVTIGSCQRVLWNGNHGKRPLFSLD